MICLKIRTFVVSATTRASSVGTCSVLWFAWKFVPLWYQQQHPLMYCLSESCCDLLENSYLCGISNNKIYTIFNIVVLWFAWKFVPLWYQQQHPLMYCLSESCCDLLENSYLCGISNNIVEVSLSFLVLWFAWKFVPLWYQQQPLAGFAGLLPGCDLLENSYLCGISNNPLPLQPYAFEVVICLKIRTFVVSATTFHL